MDTKREIRIRGAKEHNLQNIDLDIPRDKFVVLTGLSGSESHRWRLIPFMQKDSADIWSRCHLMPECSWDRWRSRMLRA